MATSKILVIDDSEVVRLEMNKILCGAGYETVLAVDGHDGIKKANDHRDLKMVITDYNMPGINGLELSGKIKELPYHKETFIAVLTTESNPTLKKKGKSYGVGLWIIKPVEPDELVNAVNMIMKSMVS